MTRILIDNGNLPDVQEGCEECDCFRDGTIGRLGVCDQVWDDNDEDDEDDDDYDYDYDDDEDALSVPDYDIYFLFSLMDNALVNLPWVEILMQEGFHPMNTLSFGPGSSYIS